MEFDYPEVRYTKRVFEELGWKSTLIVTDGVRENLSDVVRKQDATVLDVEDVDVKDLLEKARVVIEKKALDRILEEHQSDLVKKIRNAA